MQVVGVGIGYGQNDGVQAYNMQNFSELQDFNKVLGETLGSLKEVNHRHVLGWCFENSDKPGEVVLVGNPPADVQDQTTATKQDLGNTTPYGGKASDFLLKLADQGAISMRDAYAVGAYIAETPELSRDEKLQSATLDLLNRIKGGPTIEVRDKGLYVNGDYAGDVAMSELSKKGKKVDKLAFHQPIGLDYGKIGAHFDDMVGTLSVGLNKVDHDKNEKYTATIVFNTWSPLSSEEIESLPVGAELEHEYSPKRALSIPLATLGKEYKTTVSNFIAGALFIENYGSLMDAARPEEVPNFADTFAFRDAQRKDSLDEVVGEFLEVA